MPCGGLSSNTGWAVKGECGPSTWPPSAPARLGLSAMTGLPPVFRIRPVAMESQMIVSVAAFKRDDGSPVREGDTIYLRGAADDWDDVSSREGTRS